MISIRHRSEGLSASAYKEHSASTVAPFTHAFKRWTGKTPREARATTLPRCGIKRTRSRRTALRAQNPHGRLASAIIRGTTGTLCRTERADKPSVEEYHRAVIARTPAMHNAGTASRSRRRHRVNVSASVRENSDSFGRLLAPAIGSRSGCAVLLQRQPSPATRSDYRTRRLRGPRLSDGVTLSRRVQGGANLHAHNCSGRADS